MRKLALALIAACFFVGLSSMKSQTLDSPFHVGGDVSRPIQISSLDMDCTPKKYDKKTFTHIASALMVIDEQGVPQRVRLTRGSGSDQFDQCFVKNVQRSRFKPATQKGVPVCVDMSMEVHVSLF